ncbi:regulatory protein GemA [Bartonella machadoae]|uniref:regulatory protein GemA n=1 Tax=Bartonella machadoae TaxID=2893471 RepID=UPI001F4CD5AD|nr:regulatory protein GemA [Bartonella machadoae]UNE54190.1 regulatory protein GemA [Bartonella machadoae]UNE55097.1 regulatory protein GemA [Bartonella machadoae]UNE55404.1 regulatory protein GemA [Bartonella machadoae]
MSLAVLHMGKRALGLDDETYRALLFRLTGKQSAKDLTVLEQRLVVDEMKAFGFQEDRKRLEGKYAKKLQALWIAGWNLGIIRDRSDKALLAFVKRQTGIDHIRFLRDGDDAAKAIEALKNWLQREGGVDWKGKKIQDSLQKRLGQKLLGYLILRAQWKRLHPRGSFDLEAFHQGVMAVSGKGLDEMDVFALRQVMNVWGRKIRGRKDYGG